MRPKYDDSNIRTDACEHLWQACWLQAAVDAMESLRNVPWLGSDDARMVCLYAGRNPDSEIPLLIRQAAEAARDRIAAGAAGMREVATAVAWGLLPISREAAYAALAKHLETSDGVSGGTLAAIDRALNLGGEMFLARLNNS